MFTYHLVNKLFGFSLLATAALAGATPALAAGPTGEYYLTSGEQSTLHVVQGSNIVDSWAINKFDYPIAVGKNVSVANFNMSTNQQYTLDGTLISSGTGVYTENFYDGTTDGQFNYAWDFGSSKAYKFDLNWSNPTELFSLDSEDGLRLGITYDDSNNSLWVSDWNNRTISNYAMDGNLLSSFEIDASNIHMVGLALDYADNTLWFGNQNDLGSDNRTLYQYSRSGQFLSSQTYSELNTYNYFGGEFKFGQSSESTPEPDSLLGLLALGCFGAASGFKRKLQSK
jgi:hypothetical protein